jgi:putative toxin-antitoxin system antitoxin component (TIGR02293 family)
LYLPGGVISSTREARHAEYEPTATDGRGTDCHNGQSGAAPGEPGENPADRRRAAQRASGIHLRELAPARLDTSAAELAGVTRIAVRTLTRRKAMGRFHPDESERIYRISSLFDHAEQVMGSAESARQWLKSPQRALGGRTPLAFSDTEPGAREVDDLLGRIEHGVFS